MDAILGLVGTIGWPSSFVGVVLFLYLTLRKQESGVREEQIATMERLRADVKELTDQKAVLNDEIDRLRETNSRQYRELTRLAARIDILENSTST